MYSVPHGEYKYVPRLEVGGFPFPAKFCRNFERILRKPACTYM